MQRIALAALALLVATLAGCGGTPEPPSPTQLLEDVRVAMEIAPSFRFEGTWITTVPGQGTGEVRISGDFSGENAYVTSESVNQEISFFGETLIVDGDYYTRSTPPPGSPIPNEWRSSPNMQQIVGARDQRQMILPPESADRLQVEQAQLNGNDVWILTGENIATSNDSGFVDYSITPITTYTWTIAPRTVRLLAFETTTDFGIATFTPEAGVESGRQIFQQTWRIFDYDADIVVTVPPDVTPRKPTPTPRTGGEDVDYTLLLEATTSVTPDEWDATIAIVDQRFRRAPAGIHLEWVSVGQVEIRLSAHTLTVEQAVAIATPKGHFEIMERQCESYPCDADGAYEDKPTRLTNASIASASSSRNSITDQPVVLFEMTRATAVALADLTTRLFDTNVIGGTPDELAFVLDGETLVSAVVSSPILAGSGQINGDFTEAEIQVIAALIAGAPLPVGLRLVSAEAQ